jgi:hypothetical protein
MANEPSGRDGDDADDRWIDPSTTEPEVEPADNPNGTGDTATDGTDPDGSDAWNGIPIDLSGSSDADGSADADERRPEASSTPIEPGQPDLENALFVLLGAIAMVLVLVRLVLLPLG